MQRQSSAWKRIVPGSKPRSRDSSGRPAVIGLARRKHFNLERHRYSRTNFKVRRDAALHEWRELLVA